MHSGGGGEIMRRNECWTTQSSLHTEVCMQLQCMCICAHLHKHVWTQVEAAQETSTQCGGTPAVCPTNRPPPSSRQAASLARHLSSLLSFLEALLLDSQSTTKTDVNVPWGCLASACLGVQLAWLFVSFMRCEVGLAFCLLHEVRSWLGFLSPS